MFVQDNACAVPVPATKLGGVVAVLTVIIVLVGQPFVAVITPVYVPAALNVTTLLLALPTMPEEGPHV